MPGNNAGHAEAAGFCAPQRGDAVRKIRPTHAVNAQGLARLAIDPSPRGMCAGTACMQVQDTGSGVPSDVQPRLFQPFVTTKTHGTGLGLAICKKIMDAHQGAIRIENPLRGGTRVILEFPQQDPANS